VPLTTLTACKRDKLPFATRLWLGPSGGCAETKPHATTGTLACWGVNDVGQVGDGRQLPRLVPSAISFSDQGTLTSLALGARHTCGVFDRHKAYCWGDGGRGQLGSAIPASPLPVSTGDDEAGVDVAVGAEHTCIWRGQHVRCFGSDSEGQLGKGGGADGASVANEWLREANIRSVALGDAHTCVAYARSKASPELVLCRGRKIAAPREPLLSSVVSSIVVTALAAGGDHTCALLEDRTVRCWGKNDSGQLGDGTTNDAIIPVAVLDLRGVTEIGAGNRHTCARVVNGTVACWGANDHHQLANGTTERSARAVQLRLMGIEQIAVAGDSACVRTFEGFVRCWGANDRGQLGDGTTVEHDVPMPPRFRTR
jgi:alpha-tubulin suppressor-like RCC1 family protein